MIPVLDTQKRLVAYASNEYANQAYRRRQATVSDDRPTAVEVYLPSQRQTFRMLLWAVPIYEKGYLRQRVSVLTMESEPPEGFWRAGDIVDVRHATPIAITEKR